MTVQLTSENERKVQLLSSHTGRSPDDLVNEAVEQLSGDSTVDEQTKFRAWQEAMRNAAGIWAERDDLPDFEDIRRSMDRDLWSSQKHLPMLADVLIPYRKP